MRPLSSNLGCLHLRPRDDLQAAILDDFSQGFFDKMGAHFAFNLIAVHSLEYVARDFAAAKTFDSDSLAEVLVSAGEFAGNSFCRKFDANFSLHGTQFIDINFHDGFLPRHPSLVAWTAIQSRERNSRRDQLTSN